MSFEAYDSNKKQLMNKYGVSSRIMDEIYYYRNNRNNRDKNISRIYEREIEMILTIKGVKYKRENTIKEKNKGTPDFLVSGGNSNWIEVKSYYGIDNDRKLFDDMVRQFSRYIRNYGSGMLIFRDYVDVNLVELLESKFGGKLKVVSIETQYYNLRDQIIKLIKEGGNIMNKKVQYGDIGKLYVRDLVDFGIIEKL